MFMKPPRPGNVAPRETTPLRFVSQSLAVVLVGLAFVGIVVSCLSPLQDGPLKGKATVALADGSFVTVPLTTVGIVHNWVMPYEPTWSDWWHGRSRPAAAGVQTKTPGLVVWVVRHDNKTARPLLWPKLRHARLIVGRERIASVCCSVYRQDETPVAPGARPAMSTHTVDLPIGVEHSTLNSTTSAMPFVYGFQFPMLPAGCGPLRLELLGEAPGFTKACPVLAKLELPEPAGLGTRSNWTAQPLPATCTIGSHTLTLTGFRKTGQWHGGDREGNQPLFAPVTELASGSATEPGRLYGDGLVVDSVGNPFPGAYGRVWWPRFGPHRLSVTARVPTAESLLSESRGEMADLVVPPDGANLLIHSWVGLRSKRVTVHVFFGIGRGHTICPDVSGSPRLDFWQREGHVRDVPYRVQRVDVPIVGGGSSPRLVVDAQLIHFTVSTNGLAPHERLEIRKATDDPGRDVPFSDMELTRAHLLFLDPAPDARSVRLGFEVFDTAEFEFVVDPPRSPDR